MSKTDVERTFKTAKQVDRIVVCQNFHEQFVPDLIWEPAGKNISLEYFFLNILRTEIALFTIS